MAQRCVNNQLQRTTPSDIRDMRYRFAQSQERERVNRIYMSYLLVRTINQLLNLGGLGRGLTDLLKFLH